MGALSDRSYLYSWLQGVKRGIADLYLETNRHPDASRVALEIAENFTEFGIHTFLKSMEWLSVYFYGNVNGSGNGKTDHLNESYTWMEMARIAANDYGLQEGRLSQYEHFIL